MRKRLSKLGNTMALIIDQPIRRILGINHDTVLRITIEGYRLIVEPLEMVDDDVAKRPVRPKPAPRERVISEETLRARELVEEMERVYRLNQARYEQLFGRPMAIVLVLGALFHDDVETQRPLIAKRAVCKKWLDAGDSWEVAIAKTLEAFDPDRSGPGHAVGAGLLDLEVEEALAGGGEVDGDRGPGAAGHGLTLDLADGVAAEG